MEIYSEGEFFGEIINMEDVSDIGLRKAIRDRDFLVLKKPNGNLTLIDIEAEDDLEIKACGPLNWKTYRAKARAYGWFVDEEWE